MRFLFAFCSLAFGGCSLLFPGGSPDDVLFSGTSFGECLGYCVTELTVEGREATLVYSGWEIGQQLPDIEHRRTLSDAERLRLERAFDRAALRRADEIYGCPDCADGGAEWVGASGDGAEKRVTFEYGDEVGGLDDYIEVMRALRVRFPGPPTN